MLQQQQKKQTTSRLEIDKRYENANEAKRSRKHDESMARSKTESARTTTLLTVSEMRLCFFRIFTANSFPSFSFLLLMLSKIGYVLRLLIGGWLKQWFAYSHWFSTFVYTVYTRARLHFTALI